MAVIAQTPWTPILAVEVGVGYLIDNIFLMAFLLAGGVAIGLTEWRRRVRLVAAGGAAPSTERYRPSASLVLSRVEAARVARHPAIWIGLAATVAFAWRGLDSTVATNMFGPAGARQLGMFLPLVVGLFLAIHLSVARDRRHGMDELARTLPIGDRSRTLGHLLTAGWIALTLGVAALAGLLVVLGPDRGVDGVHPPSPWTTTAVWTPGPLELVQTPLAVAILAVLAVAAARWWPHPAAGVLVPAVLLLSPFAWAVSFVYHAGPRVEWETGAPVGVITTTHVAWHAVFLVGYLVLVAALALLRHDRRPALLSATAIGLITMVVSYVVKVPGVALL